MQVANPMLTSLYDFLFFEVTVASEDIAAASVDNVAASVNIHKVQSHLKKQSLYNRSKLRYCTINFHSNF